MHGVITLYCCYVDRRRIIGACIRAARMTGGSAEINFCKHAYEKTRIAKKKKKKLVSFTEKHDTRTGMTKFIRVFMLYTILYYR